MSSNPLSAARAASPGQVRSEGRVIRPAPESEGVLLEDRAFRLQDVDELVRELQRRSSGRLDALREAAREVEEKLRKKIEDSRKHIQEAMEVARRSIDRQVKATALKSEEILERRHAEGFASGEQDGFRKGYEEGLEKGLLEGREEGRRKGEEEARKEVLARLEASTDSASQTIHEIAAGLGPRWEQLLSDARGDLVQLVLEVSQRVIRHEISREPRSVVESCLDAAIERVVACHRLTIEIHPEDRAIVDAHLDKVTRALDGCTAIEVAECVDVERGGVRLRAGVQTVDQTIATQLEILEQRLKEAGGVPA